MLFYGLRLRQALFSLGLRLPLSFAGNTHLPVNAFRIRSLDPVVLSGAMATLLAFISQERRVEGILLSPTQSNRQNRAMQGLIAQMLLRDSSYFCAIAQIYCAINLSIA